MAIQLLTIIGTGEDGRRQDEGSWHEEENMKKITDESEQA